MPHQYGEVCMKLIDQYPVLRDRIPTRGCFYHSWVMSLRQKFKDYRRCLNGSTYRDAMKKKYGGQKRVAQKSPVKDKVSRRCSTARSPNEKCLVSRSDDWKGECEASIQNHITCIQQEAKKQMPNNDVILDRMGRTFECRRCRILSGLSTGEVMEEFPVFEDGYWVLHEVTAICGTDLCADISTKRDDVQMLINWSKVPVQVKDLMRKENCSWRIGIPSLFNEDYSSFLAIDGIPETAYPTVVYFEQKWSVHVDGVEIVNISDFEQALSVFVGCFWVFNIEFPKKARNSLTFLSKCVSNLPGVVLTPPVLRVMNNLI